MTRNLSLLCAFIAAIVISADAQTSDTASPESDWQLVWSDEFNGSNGSAIDTSKWTIETGGKGWGNKELEYYTGRPQNVFLQDGHLVIRALKEKYTGTDRVSRNYTSGRLKTLGKFSQQYGRFEARVKVPAGPGTWPAFWMLGDDVNQVGWPACGEIDVMEHLGKEPDITHGSIHGPGYTGALGLEARFRLPGGQRFSDDFHLFAIEWDPQSISFYVDQSLLVTRTRADLRSGWRWVFDKPFFIIMNLAVGGIWPGNPNSSTVFPADMQVDYVRVYQQVKRSKR